MKLMLSVFLLISIFIGNAGTFRSLVGAIRSNKYNQFEESLASNDLDINETTWGVTPLYIAVHFGRVQMIKPIIEKGADINALCGSKKRTALHKAVSKGNEEIVRLLLDAGADYKLANKYGKTPYEEAEKRGYQNILMILGENNN